MKSFIISPAFALLSALLSNGELSAAEAAPIRVALYDDAGSFGKGIPRAMELVGKAPGMKLTSVTAEDIRAGKLGEYDVVMFTGGSGSKQGNALQPEGVKNVVRRKGRRLRRHLRRRLPRLQRLFVEHQPHQRQGHLAKMEAWKRHAGLGTHRGRQKGLSEHQGQIPVPLS